MKAVLIVFFTIIFNVIAHANALNVKTYREWKADKLQLATSQIQNFKMASEAKLSSTRGAKSGQDVAKLNQLQFNLEVAKDLTIYDYYSIYLNSLDNIDSAVRSVAQRMTPEETAELMLAFTKVSVQSISTEVSDSN